MDEQHGKQPAKVLVVGAGALGTTCAWHLQRGGAEVSFLVRPSRAAALGKAPVTLFCLNDDSVATIAPCAVHSDPGELGCAGFDYILFTPDGTATRSTEGTDLLKTLHRPGRTVLVLCAVGIGLRDQVIEASGWEPERVVQGTMSMLAYPVAQWSHPLADARHQAGHDRCNFAYVRMNGRPAFSVASRPSRASKGFAACLASTTGLEVKRVPATLYEIFTSMFFPFPLASELDGWRGTPSLIGNTRLWALCCASQREIMRLRRHGLAGRLLALMSRDGKLAQSMLAADRGSGALDFTAFNRFHHGHKVSGQALQILRLCRDEGQRDGTSMPATTALLDRIRLARAHEHSPASNQET